MGGGPGPGVLALGNQALQQVVAAGELPGRQGAGVLQVALQVVPRAGGRALGGEHVGDIGNRHRGDHHHFAPGPGHRHVEPAFAVGLPQHHEVAPEAALAVAPEGRGKHDDVALVALDVLDVLGEHRHVFAVLAVFPSRPWTIF